MWIRPLGRAKCRRVSQWNCRRWIDRHARGGRGVGAPAGGAPGAEPSARAGLWKRGSSLRGADDQPRFTGGSVGTISLICQRTRASDRLSARLLCGTLAGRQATHRMVIDAPSSSSDQQRVKVVETSHRRQSSAAQKAAGEVRVVAARPRLASCSRQKLSSTSALPPYLTLPYLTLPSEGANLTANGCNARRWESVVMPELRARLLVPARLLASPPVEPRRAGRALDPAPLPVAARSPTTRPASLSHPST